MTQLKPITASGIPGALDKAERYRLLNDASAAESICLDVLAIQPDHQPALIMLLLARTDQFLHGLASAGVARAREVLPRIRDEYKREYYAGIICERRATAQLRTGGPGAAQVAYEWFQEAFACYARAERLRPEGNDEVLLRWNTCVRILHDHPEIAPADPGSRVVANLGE